MHNYHVLPVRDRDVLVSAWNLGGTSVIDFTDPFNPREIGYVDVQETFEGRGPWSSYWYNGFIYAGDRGRGLDVLLLSDPGARQRQALPLPQRADPGGAHFVVHRHTRRYEGHLAAPVLACPRGPVGLPDGISAIGLPAGG